VGRWQFPDRARHLGDSLPSIADADVAPDGATPPMALQRIDDRRDGLVDGGAKESLPLLMCLRCGLRTEVTDGLERAARRRRNARDAGWHELIERGGRVLVDVALNRAGNRFEDCSGFPDRLEMWDRAKRPRKRTRPVIEIAKALLKENASLFAPQRLLRFLSSLLPCVVEAQSRAELGGSPALGAGPRRGLRPRLFHWPCRAERFPRRRP